jgi:predicted dehydrogenase
VEVSRDTFLRVGIVGAGLMGRWHADVARRSGARVAAIMDPDLERAARLSARHSKVGIFPDLETMLEQVELDVLHICSPGPTHYPIASTAIDAGLHVLIEKPISPMAADTERLFDRAGKHGKLVCPVHQFMFQDGVLKAKELLPRVGRLIHLEATMCSAGGADLPAAELDQIVADVLPHPLSLLQMFLSRKLSPERWVIVRPGEGELRVLGETGNATFGFFLSMNARPTTNSLRIVGTEGTIHLNLFHGYGFLEPGQVSRSRKIIHPFALSTRSLTAATINLCRRALRQETAYPGLRRLVAAFYESVQTGSPSPIPAEDTILVARVRDHIIRSAGLINPQREYVDA